jgi:SET family sugar efflux transporter-like MFS transporter
MNSTQIGSTVGYLLFGVFAEAISYGNVILVYTFFAGVALLCLILFGKERLKTVETGKVKVRKI